MSMVTSLVFLEGECMTFQASMLVRKLKRVQQSEAFSIEIDDMCSMFSTYGCDKANVINFSAEKKWEDYKNYIGYLIKSGYVVVEEENDLGNRVIKLTHDGFHFGQISFIRALKTISKSVFLPIIVSVITTLVTIWIKNKLGVPLE